MNFATKFIKYNDRFELLDSQDIFAIYKRTNGQQVHYESVIFYVNKKGEWFYPGSSSWGQRGWSYPTYEQAKERYEKNLSTRQNLISSER